MHWAEREFLREPRKSIGIQSEIKSKAPAIKCNPSKSVWGTGLTASQSPAAPRWSAYWLRPAAGACSRPACAVAAAAGGADADADVDADAGCGRGAEGDASEPVDVIVAGSSAFGPPAPCPAPR